MASTGRESDADGMTTPTLPHSRVGKVGARTGPVTVLIADDHPLFRRGMARAVRRDPALELVGEATDGREALDLIAALRPAVAVVDQRMPELTGIDVCAQLRLAPDGVPTRVVVLSAFDDEELVRAAVAAGAAGYLSKTAGHRDVCAAIEHVARGGLAFPLTPPRRTRGSWRSHLVDHRERW
jgi:two-component system nitrate/nitrite response regulator NarL